MRTQYTYTVVKLAHPQGGHMWMFYDDDGMLIGSVAGAGARYGPDVNLAITRAFLSDEHAIAWVKRKCREASVDAEIVWQERDDTTSLIIPNGPVGNMGRKH